MKTAKDIFRGPAQTKSNSWIRSCWYYSRFLKFVVWKVVHAWIGSLLFHDWMLLLPVGATQFVRHWTNQPTFLWGINHDMTVDLGFFPWFSDTLYFPSYSNNSGVFPNFPKFIWGTWNQHSPNCLRFNLCSPDICWRLGVLSSTLFIKKSRPKATEATAII